MKKKSLFYCVLLQLIGLAMAKSQSNWHCQQIVAKDSLALKDSLTIIPATLQIWQADTLIAPLYYSFQRGQLSFTPAFIHKTTTKALKVCYRVLPFLLEKKMTHLDSNRLRPKVRALEWNFQAQDANSSNSNILPNDKELLYSGGLSRAISVGNNQDLVLNSNFNLQMSGKLSKDVEINAAMSDNNIPIQPDGNTAQLNQFDRIFIQIKRKQTMLNIGDFEVQRPESYFINYFKRLQGLGIQHTENFAKKKTWTTKANAAISRGKFNRQLIQGSEGNLGPYRLQGAEGERFIIIIAGTEKIYLDGVLLKRGYENDYTMDYNQGVLVFTNNRLITKDSRIVAEFDYSDQSFTRSMYTVNSQYQTERLRLSFNLYGEQDSKTSGIQQSLKEIDKQNLIDAGDRQDIFTTGIDTVSFSTERILYKVMLDNQGNTIFAYSQNPDSAKYALRFLEVGGGQGDYNLKLSASNGRVFQYVGAGKGNFRIGDKLIAPKLVQVYSLGADYQLFKKKNAQIKTEFALSNNDLNRLSSLDSKDDLGLATMLQYKHQIALIKQWRLKVDAAYEGLHQNFKILNPYRPVEFTRDWNTNNLPLTTSASSEYIIKSNIQLIKDSVGIIEYEYSRFDKSDFYSGNKQLFAIDITRKGWHFKSTNSLLQSQSLVENSLFFRPKLDLKKIFKQKSSVGLYFEKERNERLTNDTLSKLSFDFDILKLYTDIQIKKNITIGAFMQQRVDFLTADNQFEKVTTAHELNFNGTYKSKFGLSVMGNISYRKLLINKPTLINLQPQETYLGRVNINFTKWKNTLVAATTYELGSGQEQKIEYFYQKVQPGLGNLSWRDFNKDGIIQQDEVFPAIFQDSANIVRFVLPTNQFVRTNNLGFNQLLNLTPKNIWQKKRGILKTLSFFSTESAWQILNKVKINAAKASWSPFTQFEITDTALVAANKTQRHTLFFNRNHHKIELSAGTTDSYLRNILVTGYDIRGQTDYFLRMRWNISKKITVRSGFTNSYKLSDSEFFPVRNYQIYSNGVESDINIALKKNFRLHLNYKFTNSLDTLKEREAARMNDFSSEVFYNYSTKTAIRAKAALVKIAYEGILNSPAQYVMLNALQRGNNYLWELQFNQALNKTLQLELRYNGRKTGTSPRIIHTGNMAIRALF
jgi:hypothetical protein